MAAHEGTSDSGEGPLRSVQGVRIEKTLDGLSTEGLQAAKDLATDPVVPISVQRNAEQKWQAASIRHQNGHRNTGADTYREPGARSGMARAGRKCGKGSCGGKSASVESVSP